MPVALESGAPGHPSSNSAGPWRRVSFQALVVLALRRRMVLRSVSLKGRKTSARMTCERVPGSGRVGSGCERLHVWCSGPRFATDAVLLIHGLLGSIATWTPLLKRCFFPRRKFHVVAIDLLGHGLSRAQRSDNTASYSLEAHLASLLAVVDAHRFAEDCCCCCSTGNRGLEDGTQRQRQRRRLHVVGYSTGSLLAIEVARARRCASLSLLATPFFTTVDFARQKLREHSFWVRHPAFAQFVCNHVVCAHRRMWGHILPAAVHAFARGGRRIPTQVVRDSMEHDFVAISATSRAVFEAHRPSVAGLRARVVLVINGARDRLCFPEGHRALVQSLQSCADARRISTVVLPAGDHQFVLFCVDVVAQALAKVIRSKTKRRRRVRR